MCFTNDSFVIASLNDIGLKSCERALGGFADVFRQT